MMAAQPRQGAGRRRRREGLAAGPAKPSCTRAGRCRPPGYRPGPPSARPPRQGTQGGLWGLRAGCGGPGTVQGPTGSVEPVSRSHVSRTPSRGVGSSPPTSSRRSPTSVWSGRPETAATAPAPELCPGRAPYCPPPPPPAKPAKPPASPSPATNSPTPTPPDRPRQIAAHQNCTTLDQPAHTTYAQVRWTPPRPAPYPASPQTPRTSPTGTEKPQFTAAATTQRNWVTTPLTPRSRSPLSAPVWSRDPS